MEIHEFEKQLENMKMTEADKINMLITFIGCAAKLTEYIAQEYLFKDQPVPMTIKYIMALVAGNMSTLTSTNPVIGKLDLAKMERQAGEQELESEHRKFKFIIQNFAKTFEETDKI